MYVCFQQCPEDCGDIHPVFWAAFLTAPLWLWYASCQICAHSSWQSQTEVPRGGWIHSSSQGYQWCQLAQILSSGMFSTLLSLMFQGCYAFLISSQFICLISKLMKWSLFLALPNLFGFYSNKIQRKAILLFAFLPAIYLTTQSMEIVWLFSYECKKHQTWAYQSVSLSVSRLQLYKIIIWWYPKYLLNELALFFSYEC